MLFPHLSKINIFSVCQNQASNETWYLLIRLPCKIVLLIFIKQPHISCITDHEFTWFVFLCFTWNIPSYLYNPYEQYLIPVIIDICLLFLQYSMSSLILIIHVLIISYHYIHSISIQTIAISLLTLIINDIYINSLYIFNIIDFNIHSSKLIHLENHFFIFS